MCAPCGTTCGPSTRAALNTRGGPNEIELTVRVLTDCFIAPFQACGPLLHQRDADADADGLQVRLPSSSIPPQWRSIRFRLALRTYDAPPCGPSVRVVSLTKSREIPNRNILPLFFVSRYIIAEKLPPINYLALIDYYVIACYLVLFTVVMIQFLSAVNAWYAS